MEDNLKAARWRWAASLRGLSWPQLNASLSRNRLFSDTDTGIETNVWTNEAAVTLAQPLLTGTRLSLTNTWNQTTTDTTISTVTTQSVAKKVPNLSASVTQPLYIFQRNAALRSRREANIGWQNDQDRYRREHLAIRYEARGLYYNLLRQIETTKVERKKAESARLIHNVTRSLVKAGKLAEVELIRADIRAKRDLRRIQNAENNLEQNLNQAKDLIGLPAHTTLQLTSSLRYIPFRWSLDQLLQEAEKTNPDLLTAQRDVELARLGLQKTKEADRPAFNANASYSLTENRLDATAPLSPYGWSAGLRMDWPLFDATQTRLRTKQSEVALENARRAFENQRRQLQVAIQNGYLEMKRTEEQIKDFEQQKDQAENNLRAIRLQYQNGLTRLTDVFDAENELRDLELEYLNLLVTFNTAVDRLFALVGREL